MSHPAYREYIAHYLITTSLETTTCTKKKPPVPIDNTEMRLSGKHFVSKLDTVVGSKRKALQSLQFYTQTTCTLWPQ